MDYEEVHWLNFTVRASDNGSPPRAAEIPVYLEIVDVNDNNPIFDQPSYQVGGQTNMGVRTSIPWGHLVSKWGPHCIGEFLGQGIGSRVTLPSLSSSLSPILCPPLTSSCPPRSL